MILFFDIYYIGNFHVKWILGQVLIKLLKSLTKLKVTVCKGRLFYTKQPFILLTIQNYKKRKRIICLKIWPQKPETKLDCQWSTYIKDKEITSHCYENKTWKSTAQIVSMSLEKEFFFNIGVHCMISVILCLSHLCLHGTCTDNSFILDLLKI